MPVSVDSLTERCSCGAEFRIVSSYGVKEAAQEWRREHICVMPMPQVVEKRMSMVTRPRVRFVKRRPSLASRNALLDYLNS